MKKELVLAPSKKYNDILFDVIESIAEKHRSICYVSLNKTEGAMMELLKARGIDPMKFVFIDFISPQVLMEASSKWSIYKDCFTNVEQFVERIVRVVKKEEVTMVIFDSLSSFLVYESDKTLLEFFSCIIPRLEEMDVSILMTALTEDANKRSIKDIRMRVDRETILR